MRDRQVRARTPASDAPEALNSTGFFFPLAGSRGARLFTVHSGFDAARRATAAGHRRAFAERSAYRVARIARDGPASFFRVRHRSATFPRGVERPRVELFAWAREVTASPRDDEPRLVDLGGPLGRRGGPGALAARSAALANVHRECATRRASPARTPRPRSAPIERPPSVFQKSGRGGGTPLLDDPVGLFSAAPPDPTRAAARLRLPSDDDDGTRADPHPLASLAPRRVSSPCAGRFSCRSLACWSSRRL